MSLKYKTMIDMVILLILVLIVDVLWLTIAKKGYMRIVQSVQGSPLVVKIIPAILSYICVLIGIAMFAIPMIQSKIKTNSATIDIFKNCLMYGGGLGLAVYGVFNFTNMAIFNGYEVVMALTDTAWGITLFTLSTFMYFTILKRLF